MLQCKTPFVLVNTILDPFIEPQVEPHFKDDSYGYRPNKSALEAIGVTRTRCWENDWVLEFDIKGLFDNIPHQLLQKAVDKHTDNAWIKLYIKRWLTAPMIKANGEQIARTQGTPPLYTQLL